MAAVALSLGANPFPYPILCHPDEDAAIVQVVLARTIEIVEQRLEAQAVAIANAVGRLLK